MTRPARLPKKTSKIEIKCSEETRIQFKRVAAEFSDYESVIVYLVENYEALKIIRPPMGRTFGKKHGLL